ncbi:MAG: hypothetical protein IJJ33_12935 [Victivallales bacterium]|nr:hypothetical protein [Victivallales bacterium]
MFRPVKMCKVNILVLNRHEAAVARALGESGLVHLVDAVQQSAEHLLTAETDGERPRPDAMLPRLDHVISSLGLVGRVDGAAPSAPKAELPWEEMAALLDKLEHDLQENEEQAAQLIEETGALDRQRATVAGYPVQDIRMELLRNLAHVHVFVGRLAAELESRCMLELGERAVMVKAEHGDGILVLCTKRNRGAVRSTLDRFGFQETPVPEVTGSAIEERDRLDGRIAALQKELEDVRQKALRLAEQHGETLLAMRAQLRTAHALEEARRLFGKSSRLRCISGWAPKESVGRIQALVAQATDGTGVVEAVPAEKDARVHAGLEAVPVEMRGGLLRSPFQMLIKSYGLPGYNELDPTVFVGVTFVLLFGFMFGDIGQGAALALIGWLLRKKSTDQTFREGGLIIMLCGFTAVLFGFGYGSVFGYELEGEILGLRWPLWLSPLHQSDTSRLLLTAVGLGTVLMSVAVIINIVNHFLARRYFEGVFDRFGVLGLLFYWAALLAGVVAVGTGRFPRWGIAFVVIPIIALALKLPVRALLARLQKTREEGEGAGLFAEVLETGLELMETLTGYLSGTVSFVRIGAYAISHAALCVAIYAIAKQILSFHFTGSLLVSILIVALGNALVIGFEGMVAMIQSVRLEYYELFGKYFSGSGTPYHPFHIKQPNPSQGEH